MKLLDITSDPVLFEQVPTSVGVGASTLGAQQPGVQQGQPLSGQQMSPSTTALASRVQQEKRKQLQDQISQTERLLQDLRKQLADMT